MCFLFLTGEFEEESKQPSLGEQQKHQLKHRELFLSRQFESLPATHIRYVDQQVPLKIHLITPPAPLYTLQLNQPHRSVLLLLIIAFV